MRRHLARVEETELLREARGAGLRVRGGAASVRQGRVEPGLRYLNHRRDRWQRCQRQHFLLGRVDVAHLLQVVERIGVGLEHPPEMREFRKYGMAGLAGQARLPRKTWYRVCCWSRQTETQQELQTPCCVLPVCMLHGLLPFIFSDSHFLRPYLAPAARTHRLAWEDAARPPRFTRRPLQLQ